MQNFIACPSTTGKRGVTSPFTEYIKFLPLELLPTFWTEAERELLTGTTLYSAVNAKLKSLYREFENLRSATSKISWCAESWWDEIDGLISFDDWLQVDAMYRSRALEFPGIGDCMAPCIDMANHSSGDATMAIYEVDNDGNALLLLREGKDVRINDEITITYGDNKGACEMLFSYGFIEDEMESAKELFLHLPLPEDDPLARAKAAVADTAPGFKVFEHGQVIDWEGDYVWLLCVNEEDGLEFKVQRTIDGDREIKAFWKEEVLSEVKAFKSLLQADPMWEVFHLRAVSLLQDRVASQLQALYGSEDEVNATPHGEGTSIRDRPWHLSQRLRTLEAGLLEKAYAHFEDLVSTPYHHSFPAGIASVAGILRVGSAFANACARNWSLHKAKPFALISGLMTKIYKRTSLDALQGWTIETVNLI